MAKTTDLPEAGGLDGSEIVPIVKDGVTRRAMLGALVGAMVNPFVSRAEAAAYAAEGLIGHTYQTIGEGEQSTTPGQPFAVANPDGTITVYLRIEDGSIKLRTIPTSDALAHPSAGRLIGGYRSIEELLASLEPSRGAGAIWQAGQARCVEASEDTGNYDFSTASGVKLFAPRDADGRVYLTPEMFGFKAGGGDASATLNAARLGVLRARAIANKAKVIFSPGIYTLPPDQRLQAQDTEWVFAPGAILKLYSGQVINQDFLVFDRPVRQIVRNLQFDANRSAQNPALFGVDRCGTLVVSPADCVFDVVEVISSPGKGFGIVSAVGETSRRTKLLNGKGGNCAKQVFILDANNSEGYFDDCEVNGIKVGTTSHAGFAANDGVSDCNIRNINCDVGLDSVWDAVAFRDCLDLRVTNVRGRGGRHGVHFQTLNKGCTDFELANIRGEGSKGSGVLFTAVKRFRGSKIAGVNNAAAGVNLARIPLGDKRCEDVHLTGVTGIDTREVPQQGYGILLGGTRRCSINDWTATGNKIENAWLAPAVNVKSYI